MYRTLLRSVQSVICMIIDVIVLLIVKSQFIHSEEVKLYMIISVYCI